MSAPGYRDEEALTVFARRQTVAALEALSDEDIREALFYTRTAVQLLAPPETID